MGLSLGRWRAARLVRLGIYDNVNVTPVLAKNIGIDIKSSSFILFLKLEVFTSVPPDSVSIVHYRHRVSCFLEPVQASDTHEV